MSITNQMTLDISYTNYMFLSFSNKSSNIHSLIEEVVLNLIMRMRYQKHFGSLPRRSISIMTIHQFIFPIYILASDTHLIILLDSLIQNKITQPENQISVLAVIRIVPCFELTFSTAIISTFKPRNILCNGVFDG